MSAVRAHACVAVAVAAAALSACATSPYKRAGNAGEVATALARSQPRPPAARSLAFLVLEGAAGPRVAAYDLAASRLVWTQPADVTTRIAVGARRHRARQQRPSVAAPGAPASAVVVARDIGNGAMLWQHALASDERLAGYDIDANAVYLVVQKVGATKRGHRRQRRRARPADEGRALAARAADRTRRRVPPCAAAWWRSRSIRNT